jgi:hypothetical protein
MSNVFRQIALAALCAIVGAGVASAQLPTAAIRGVVSDQQGGVLPGATVSVTQTETGLARNTVTNEVGTYRIAGLPSGLYEVTLEMSGFQKQTRRVELLLNQEAEINVTLGIAGAAEVVQVVAETPVIETTRSEMGRTFKAEQIRDMPLANRNYLNLAFLIPGVASGGTGLNQGFGGSVNGQRARNVNFIIDGSDNNDASVPGARSPLIQDAVGEFRLVTSVFSAELGRNSGAVAIAATKSGTNDFHGTVFEFFEDAEKFNARTNLEKRVAALNGKPAKLRRDTYGFSFGGPVLRNKVFFFGAGQRRPFEGRGASPSIAVPTQAGRAMLAALPGASPVMVELLNKHIPLPNAGGARTVTAVGTAIPFENYIATVPNSSGDDQVIVRGDVNLSSNDNVFSRYIYRKNQSIGASNPPGFAADSVFPTHNFVTTWNRVLSASLLNELHVSYGQTGGLFPGGSQNAAGNNELPNIGITGFWAIGLPVNIPQDRKEKVFQVTDSVSYLRGNHAFKVGADVRKVKLTSFVPFDFRGTYTFQNWTEFITNRPFLVRQAYGDPEPNFDYFEQAYFAQDDWKVRPNLTVNLGIRYEFTGASQGFYSNVKDDTNNWAPRIGFAYDLSEKGRMVLRGGYGMTYDQFFLNIPLLAAQGPPFQRRIDDFSVLPYPSVPRDRELTEAELLGLSLVDIPDNSRFPYSHQWQLSLQRQLGQTWRAEAAYVGSRGLNLIRQRVGNPVICCPVETFRTPAGTNALRRHGNPLRSGQDTILESSSRSSYHSGQFSLDKRFSNGFSLNTNYTFSKFIDDASESLGTGAPSIQRPQDNFDLNNDKAVSSFHRAHRFIVGGLYQLPWMRTQEGLFGRIVGGWNLGASYVIQSGQPFTVITGVDSNGDGDPVNDRPNVGTGDPKTVAGYVLNPLRSGINGNLGRNTGRGPRENNVNAVLYKNFRVYRQQQLQVRGELFNLLNHRQFSLLTSGVDRNLSVPATFYDFRTSNGGSRTVVLGVKYLF